MKAKKMDILLTSLRNQMQFAGVSYAGVAHD